MLTVYIYIYITVEQLQCWASWSESDYQKNNLYFIILGKPGKQPQYTMVSKNKQCCIVQWGYSVVI